MVEIKQTNGMNVIYLSGHVDSVNAPVIEKEIFDQITDDTTNIVIDCEKLQYISSAGLRVILKIRKSHNDVKIINVSNEVYDVLEMTGFTEMIPVEKGYRQLSIDGCPVLGEGANGIVYRYDEETIIKVYKSPDALDDIKKERALARRALIMGIPTAIPFDVVKVGDKFGSVFELLNSSSYSVLIKNDPEHKDKYINMFVDLLKKIHSTQIDDDSELHDVKRTYLTYVDYVKPYVQPGEYEKLLRLVNSIPERKTMLHGDYHTNNVQMQNGETLLIDMDTLAYGHPIFELSSMYLAFVGFGEIVPALVEKFMKLDYTTTCYIWEQCLKLYFNTTDEQYLNKVKSKVYILAYVRLLRRTIKRVGFEDPVGAALIASSKEHITKCLNEVDDLDIDNI